MKVNFEMGTAQDREGDILVVRSTFQASDGTMSCHAIMTLEQFEMFCATAQDALARARAEALRRGRN